MSRASEDRRAERIVKRVINQVSRLVEQGHVRPGLLFNRIGTAINAATVRHASEKGGGQA
jgi:hypothetical protein